MAKTEVAITAGELIRQLQAIVEQHGPDCPVATEGCDCIGPAREAEFDPSDGIITIGRNGHAEYR